MLYRCGHEPHRSSASDPPWRRLRGESHCRDI